MKTIITLMLLMPAFVYSQFNIENVGLKNKSITSLKFWYGILAVGTDQNVVYWSGYDSPDSINWKHIELPGKNIRTVYPHKSGPIGWAIGAGIRPENGDTNFVYCSYMGEKFKSISTGIDRNLTTEISKLDGFPDLTICGETFAAGGRALYRRYFADTVWYPVYNLTIEGNLSTIKVRENYPTVIAGGGDGFANHLLIKSFDKGDSWDLMSPLIYVQSLDFTDDSAKVIFVSDNYRIRKSEDYGQNWKDVFNNNNQFIINKLLYYPYLNTIFAAGTTDWDTGSGVIYYNELISGEWHQLPIKINNPIVDIDVGPDNWIYIATADSGIFRINNIVVAVEDKEQALPRDFILSQNYPNPFNPSTTIKYNIPLFIISNDQSDVGHIRDLSSHSPRNYELNVTLKVYDVLGNLVAVLVDKKQQPGTYELTFEGINFSSGIYYYQLKAGTYIDTKKMILLK